MTFDEILMQVRDLLQRQTRVSYRALKVRFNLDDVYLDALKDELIDAQRIAVDEDGKVLVWIGKGGLESSVQSLASEQVQGPKSKVQSQDSELRTPNSPP